jgi:hypothetical protein
LFGRYFDQFAVVPDLPAKWHYSAQIASALALVSLHILYPLTDAVALGFGHSRENSEDQFRNAVSSHVAAEINHVQTDAAPLKLTEHFECIECRAKHAVELRRDHRIASRRIASRRAP